MDKRFLAIVVAIIITFIGIYALTGNGSQKDADNGGSKQAKPTSHVIGQGGKGVTLTEYGDFQCSACFAYEPVLRQVVEKYRNDIYFQFRHLPLVQIHPNAFAAARAAEAAGMQGKFWEMHDKLYEGPNWQDWTNSQRAKSFFETYAKEIGLNMEQFSQDYASSKANDAINADLAAFEKTGLPKSTPTFFLNGQHVNNSRVSDANGPSLEKFSQVIDEAIAKQTNH